MLDWATRKFNFNFSPFLDLLHSVKATKNSKTEKQLPFKL